MNDPYRHNKQSRRKQGTTGGPVADEHIRTINREAQISLSQYLVRKALRDPDIMGIEKAKEVAKGRMLFIDQRHHGAAHTFNEWDGMVL